jgi:hypothetical protein
MRYLLLTYYKKADGKIDEAMTVARNVKTRDWQTANVILDFKDLKVLKCSVSGMDGVKDWDTVVAYYYKHYTHTIERLFNDNGYVVEKQQPSTEPVDQKVES